jgi:hypothetical protein
MGRSALDPSSPSGQTPARLFGWQRVSPTRCPRLALALGLALAVTVVSHLASGAQATDVLIVGSGSAELSRKLRAEVHDAGFTTVGVAPSGPVPGSSTPATLRVLAPGRVELSVARASDAARFEQILERRPAEGESFALRVVEQLRARLVDVGWTLPSPEDLESASRSDSEGSAAADDVAPLQTAAAPAPSLADGEGPSPSATFEEAGGSVSASAGGALRVWLDAGVAGSWARGGLGATAHATIGSRLELGPVWGIRVRSLWPLHDAQLEESEGEARVAWTGFSVALEHAVPLPAPWFCDMGLGGGVFVLDARADARESFEARRERLYTGAYLAEVSAGRELASWLRLRASTVAGLTAPRPVLRFDEREVASLGHVFASLSVALDVSWPAAPEATP